MAIDKLQDKIRRLKNPLVVDFGIPRDFLPPYLLESEGSFLPAYERFCLELMDQLKSTVPAVRFSFNYFALLYPDGMLALKRVLKAAKDKGFYVFLDGPEMLSAQNAAFSAEVLLDEGSEFCFDALLLISYIGTDGLRPYIDSLKNCDKDLFVVLRTANKTAAELQDLLTGSRLAHLARADSFSRFSEMHIGRYGYARISVMASATAADSLRRLRSKYKTFFIFIDGYDNASSAAKNCSLAFDKLGHGAIVCSGAAVTSAWKEADSDGWDFAMQSAATVDKIKKSLARCITVL